MERFRWLYIIGLILVLGTEGAGAPVRVVLPESVSVRGDEIFLGQVARIDGTSDLDDFSLGRSPGPGSSLNLPGSRIRIRILQQFPDAECEIPGIVRVERQGQHISEERVRVLVHEALQKENRDVSVRIRDLRLVGQNVFALGRLTLGRLETTGTGSRVRGQFPVYVDGNSAGNLRFVAQIDRMGTVLVATRNLEKDGMIRPEDLRQERRDITGLRGDVLSHPDQALGMALRLRVGEGDVLRSDRLIRPPLVRRGDPVRMVVESDNLRVHTSGQALRDGGLGDRIPVENLRTGKVVQGEVMAAGRVRLAF
ncbi:flagellar basal body P-ring formation chaperone FlgA [Desulfobotulus sp. H1]|uniref:Flagellar basal body P-ring formation chaperone FlgA n=1 Tax=Desulfobotulus pelophilus TaxID=2823377 RepID=A0ABT3N4J0_9BACT|nr:flagellar basal body P-ring formation chaperone FlgA [Desulfobotulus pelophilus]MCW7752375.1 flagellar basal body P-ring formation chaperone FlgA [Desulfobotulus pelophilus]